MTENELLRTKFKALRIPSLAKFVRCINSQLTAQTWGKCLNKDEHIELKTLLIMSQELGFSSAELRSVLYIREEKIIADMLTHDNLTPMERLVVEKFRRFSGEPVKTKLIMDLLDNLEKPPENSPQKARNRRKTDNIDQCLIDSESFHDIKDR